MQVVSGSTDLCSHSSANLDPTTGQLTINTQDTENIIEGVYTFEIQATIGTTFVTS